MRGKRVREENYKEEDVPLSFSRRRPFFLICVAGFSLLSSLLAARVLVIPCFPLLIRVLVIMHIDFY